MNSFLKENTVEKQVNTDELTQVRNRRAFFVDGERVAKDYEGFISLIMIDIDNFRQINDTHGHIIGDIILKKITALIENNIRKKDIFGLVGGEEFALVLPQADIKAAHSIAENLRKKINENEVTVGDKLLNITCSFGIASGAEGNIDKVYANAESALHLAKNNGRNRVEIYEDL